MLYIMMFLMIISGYYTFTFGISQIKQKNRLGGFSTIAIAVFGTIVPMVILYMKNK